ncbi:MAG TPA: NAD-dependent epimerase/dehydratase family protein [Acidimicrobiales bacterium]|nr:NAD-dependent epimerase/dehydratase family protein [Acidimicrobiales bacterium]
MGRRVLITGVGSFWGGRVAQALESDPGVDVIIGLGVDAPAVPLQRTEYVPADQSYSILSRIVQATRVDTILHTFLVVDSTRARSSELHEQNVIGTMNLLAAAGAPGSSVRHVVVKSSTLVYGSSPNGPTWYREETPRATPARTRIERSLLEAESYVKDFAVDNPNVVVTLLRFANVVGSDIVTPITKALNLPLVPCVFGFDPLMQFVEEDDVVRSIEFVTREGIGGTFNVAGDGRLPWSEVAALSNKRLAPMPPVATSLATAPLALIGVELPPELLALLRYGRGVDTSRLKSRGFTYRYTSAGAVENFARTMRLEKSLGPRPAYHYEHDVEQFFRHSPSVVRESEVRIP